MFGLINRVDKVMGPPKRDLRAGILRMALGSEEVWANARNISSRISFRFPNYLINSVHLIKPNILLYVRNVLSSCTSSSSSKLTTVIGNKNDNNITNFFTGTYTCRYFCQSLTGWKGKWQGKNTV